MFELVVTGAKGLDELLQSELQQLCPERATKLKPGQVLLEADLADAYRICLHSRLANRVLLKLAQGMVDQADDLYRIADSVVWSEHFDVHQTFMIDFIGTNRTINNSQFGALKIKDAIVDQFNSRMGKRPSVSKINADIRIQARFWRQELAIYLDLSGKSLHQRQYRQDTGKAPLKEHLACAMLMRSGWAENMAAPLYDPMCGSGTIVIEAALMAANIPPGRNRKVWGFSRWRKHDDTVWQQLVEQAESEIKPIQTGIFANDIDSRLVQIAKSNARAAGVEAAIQFSCADAVKYVPEIETAGYLVSNPPYGERLSEVTALLPLFDDLGLHLKQHFQNWKLSLLTSSRDLFRQLKLSAKKQYQLMNGKLECQLVNYDMDERNCEIRQTQPLNSDFANRLVKNIQRSKKWLKSQNTDCYRIYDADLPEYNVAIDCYADWLVVQEYAAPKDVPENKARQRIHQILAALPKIMQADPEKVVLKVREQQKGKEQYQKLAQRHEYLQVSENGAKFQVNLRDYLDTGLFLDHRITRQLVQQRASGKHVLNLFAYTGSVSVHAALGKATSVTTVDMSHTYIDWAKRNFQLNQLNGSQYQFIQADCTTWLVDHQAKYDLIFIDPPSFSNSKRMDNTWDVQRDHVKLLTQAKRCLKSGGEIIFSNNLRRFNLDNEALKTLGLDIEDWSQKTLPEDFKRNPKIHHCWLLTDAG
ncbi:bifunctional 23S rRNA (guanine(2069)-N(7))-methyltransferase RlmK/23S rRNA (guanine(2445)-N(2))-methyltransferase RlmL [Neptunicella sp. SCSIO 80796]|uniref:bifunctional 23S rRNA (guanine(2069)-N(7))-methyltransferase RlmK/23S rRNA (guanine(2445)-N(2))-methyltransferase RlmL n=1 Tax=Neptunicella plasticusilytica TaxID=3117012 RepID=UPI003A4E5D07